MTADLRAALLKMAAEWRDRESYVPGSPEFRAWRNASNTCANNLEAALAVEGEPARADATRSLMLGTVRGWTAGVKHGIESQRVPLAERTCLADCPCRQWDLAASPALLQGARPCVIGSYCSRHGFIHGAEAEELRHRLEALNDERVTAILEDVDARDSVAWLESSQGTIPPAQESPARLTDQEEGQ